MRGEVLDMEKLRMANADQVALGNAGKNARGDQLGPNGIVLKTQEQIEAEWAAAKAKQPTAKTVDLKSQDRIAEAVANLAPKAKPVTDDDADFDPMAATIPQPTAPQPAGPRRRVVDSE